jgi:hypothetical protein
MTYKLLKGDYMPSIDDVFASNYLTAQDIQGREPTVTITSVEPKEFKNRDGGMDKKLVIGFKGAKKKLVANVTNSKRIAYMHSKDYLTWPGKQITLFVDPFVQYGNEIRPAIRVKPPNSAAAPAPAPQTIDELEPEPEADVFGHDDEEQEIPF